ncbi:MAG: hypothetical protein ABSC94_25215 [Polyangiaceae bacterium]|jgi:hypothetical protein
MVRITVVFITYRMCVRASEWAANAIAVCTLIPASASAVLKARRKE